jgi:hypothetical protein
MALYKAKDSFKTAKNKFFGIHKIKILEEGGSLEITDYDGLPKSIQEHLEPLEAKTKKKKGDK